MATAKRRWTEEEVRLMALAAYRGELPECPVDRSFVHARDERAEQRVVPLLLSCSECGNLARFAPPASSDPLQRWSDDKARAIVLAVQRGSAIRCPNDGAALVTWLRQELGGGPSGSAYCKFCGRSLAFSSDGLVDSES